MTYHLYRTKHQKTPSASGNRLDILRHIAARMSSSWVIRNGMTGPIVLQRHKTTVAALCRKPYTEAPRLSETHHEALDDATIPAREIGPGVNLLR